MFIERLINQGNAPLVERMVQFTAARHRLLADSIANVSTPGYVQKDVSETEFQMRLRKRLAERRGAAPGTVPFDDLAAEVNDSRAGILFHDRSSRSVEQLMTDLASNAMKHNMYIELLRKQFDGMQNVLKERVA